jgi:hypothetical protein
LATKSVTNPRDTGDLARQRLHLRDKAANPKQIGRELGVRARVLEGSVQRSGNEVRVNGDRHASVADRFDRKITDLFDLQSEITGRIAFTLNLEPIAAVVVTGRAPRCFGLHFARTRDVPREAAVSRNYRAEIGLYEHALTIDPQIRRG